MMFGWLIIPLLLILAVWYFNQGNVKWPGQPDQQNSSLETLKKRFARGEISREEYEEKRKILEED
jgi:putative membrane protein